MISVRYLFLFFPEFVSFYSNWPSYGVALIDVCIISCYSCIPTFKKHMLFSGQTAIHYLFFLLRVGHMRYFALFLIEIMIPLVAKVLTNATF